MSPKELPMAPVTSEEVSPEEFLQRENDPLIAGVRITPPRLGGGGFGTITVTYKRPIFRYQLGKVGGVRR